MFWNEFLEDLIAFVLGSGLFCCTSGENLYLHEELSVGKVKEEKCTPGGEIRTSRKVNLLQRTLPRATQYRTTHRAGMRHATNPDDIVLAKRPVCPSSSSRQRHFCKAPETEMEFGAFGSLTQPYSTCITTFAFR